jgi:tetratricopeptide (TPR) repeat protein
MNTLRRIKTAFLYGRGLKRFNQKRYEDARKIFEKLSRLESESDRKELTCYYLGRSHFALGQNDDALRNMSQAYDLFRFRIEKTNDETDVEYFITLSNEYIHLLNKVGQTKKANDLLGDRDKFLRSRGYDVGSTEEN